MSHLALDVSASSTGWMVWFEGDIREKFSTPKWLKVLDVLKLSATSSNWRVFDGTSVAHGAWALKSEWSREGEPHAKLHSNLAVLHDFAPFEHIIYEQPLAAQHRGQATNAGNDILVELVGHVKSFAFAYHCRSIQDLHRASWQRDFIGPQKRGTKRKTITDLYVERARHLGFQFRKPDEAAAIGLMTYGLGSRNITPPWLKDEVLRPMMMGAR
ncbi:MULTISPECIES: hypothetical protein [unclassified Novosphingobium]|uniref:hypothetical protein n=1 Tax=unclassified Novosphingobium TaxID=2644732 RepID=UPI000D4FCBE6|nr:MULTISPECIES: hypothetical protein [unclassified Novosphingobium]PTR05232.1 hypothetical protein C8K11_1398 [Novosphingobium sp. GV055]PUA93831.1 hypothetical protein C8K12_1398 [Novosphingobium sp. GV061]PUB10825.1 hypothetical protein C8K14_1398 [Novosphingobium sp. GV079]PUB36469.1 hypothetical protein C8K10_1398 [Novosphingobium sp. GV027]